MSAIVVRHHHQVRAGGWLSRMLAPVRAWFSGRQVVAADVPPHVRTGHWNGQKFPGGMPSVDLLSVDYWTLRMHSANLFRKNLYARGIVRRIVTNEINVGLHLEATPEERILGKADDELADWSEEVENRFRLWERDPWLCDVQERLTFGELQALARLESIVAGDVLVVIRQFPSTGLPRIQLVNGAKVRTPMAKADVRSGNRIEHGVELDAMGRQVAYWVAQADGTSKRIPAWGEKSGRRLAWLLYGTEKRVDDVRGEPLLSLVIQSLKEIDQYRDSIQRKALVLSMLAMYVAKAADKPGTMPIAGGAVRRGLDVAQDSKGAQRTFRSAEMIPGFVIDELQPGEEPKAFQHQGTLEQFGEFEEAIIQGVAWALEIPPEILRLTFSHNYSASQAAINEYKMALNKTRTWFGTGFCQPIYVEWLISAALTKKVIAPSLVEAWRDAQQYDVFGAWTASDWTGAIKPAVDLSKLVGGYVEMINEGLITRDRASRELNGTKYSKNVQKLRRENEALAEAKESLEPAPPAPAPGVKPAPDTNIDKEDDDDAEAA